MQDQSYEDAEVDAVYWELGRLCSKGKQSHRANILAGDWNAVVGLQRQDEERTVGVYGVGSRNVRGEWLVNWASLRSVAIINTNLVKGLRIDRLFCERLVRKEVVKLSLNATIHVRPLILEKPGEMGIDNRETV